MSVRRTDYNAFGIVRICACSADLVSMMAAGSAEEIKDAASKLYERARAEFPEGPLSLRDDLNRMCSDFDLPLIIGARHKDDGAVL